MKTKGQPYKGLNTSRKPVSTCRPQSTHLTPSLRSQPRNFSRPYGERERRIREREEAVGGGFEGKILKNRVSRREKKRGRR
jgi:hypothetical protein